MIKFQRYPHINDFIAYYAREIGDPEVIAIIQSDVNSERDAILFSKFIWNMVNQIHLDEESGKTVLGSNDNTDILPDLSYEVTNLMRKKGFFSIWEAISDSSG